MGRDDQALLEAALERMGKLVAGVAPDQWGDPTPCDGWTVRNLVSHAVNTNRIFAAAAQGVKLERGEPEVDVMGDDPVGAWESSATAALAEYDDPGFAERPLESTFGPTTGAVIVAVHFVDILVHSWDLAKATGQDTFIPAELADPALEIARLYPETPQLRGDDGTAAFRPVVPAGEERPAHERLVAFLGRKP